ncbi:MAG: hypothetical protein EOP47_26700 [Sphingobacteriaceae bacterium]|nr:MAG: hypothetical protein EOP47_26700 [Sphingobacteriaceae bacterium]
MKKQQHARLKAILVDGKTVLLAIGHRIFSNEGQGKKLLIQLPVSLWQILGMRFHLLARLLRLGVHHFIYDGSGGYYCVYNKQCARFSATGQLIGKPVNLVGGRPLRVDLYQGAMIYGEYRSNAERSAVAVMLFDGHEHKRLFDVKNVRHIHTVRVKDNTIYFSTGDYEDEAGIWYWDGETVHPLLQGGQQRRTVDFILADDGIYYGTDTPLEQNYIYKAEYNGDLTALQEVSGSVFYMSQQSGRYWLATVIEPSEVNKSQYVELWSSNPNDSTTWNLVETFKKDIWPMKLFQYGQIQFPYVYQSADQEVWFYLQGVKGSGNSIKYSAI